MATLRPSSGARWRNSRADRAAVESARTAAADGPGQFNTTGDGLPWRGGGRCSFLESAEACPADRTALAGVLAVEFGVKGNLEDP